MYLEVSVAAQKQADLSAHPIESVPVMTSSGRSVGESGGRTYAKLLASFELISILQYLSLRYILKNNIGNPVFYAITIPR